MSRLSEIEHCRNRFMDLLVENGQLKRVYWRTDSLVLIICGRILILTISKSESGMLCLRFLG